MCGIVGGISTRNVGQILIEGLKRLEYRGYDSAGLALVNENNELSRIRRAGKVANLEALYKSTEIQGQLGIAHTRWATHGAPTEVNAHPHFSNERIAIVHNGIIENYQALRQELKIKGYSFVSDTDTEVMVHLIHDELKKTDNDLVAAVRNSVKKFEGAYGTVVIDREQNDRMVVARSGSPLVIGKGVEEFFIASDQLALLPVTRNFMFLEEGEVAEVRLDGISLFDSEGREITRDFTETNLSADAVDKGQYRHFMMKEIHEQPDAIAQCIESRIVNDKVAPEIFGPQAREIFEKVEAIQIVACGTSYNAALTAKYWIEQYIKIPCFVEIASEYRYREAFIPQNGLFVTISQSGETADTLAALKNAKAGGFAYSLSICNVPGSSLVRESDLVFLTRAGTEIGVASTKAFTTQLVSLQMLMLAVAESKKCIDEKLVIELTQSIIHLPSLINDELKNQNIIESLADEFTHKHHALFLGRGSQYPIAIEGALKLKEISYIHAEAYAAGELKHGPLALIDEDMPLVVTAPKNALLDKLKSNIEEVSARNGQIYVFTEDAKSFEGIEHVRVIPTTSCHDFVSPVLYTIPLQLLSYFVAINKGTDVDQPRNLAKSVTVE
jgi:glutamine---fructose-6-phosphate transaminase (isomerizing)